MKSLGRNAGFLVRVTAAALALGATVTLISCGSETGAWAELDRDLRRYVPPDTKVLASLRLRELRRTPIYQRHRDEIEGALRQADVLTDANNVDTIAFVSNWRRTLVIASGRFNAERLRFLPAATDGRIAIFIPSPQSRSGNLQAEQAETRQLLAHPPGGSLPPELQSRFSAVPADSQAWLVVGGNVPLDSVPMRSDMRTNMGNFADVVNGLSVALRIEKGLALRGRFICISPAGAQRVHDALRGALGLARLGTDARQTDLLKIYDAFDVQQADTNVNVKADLADTQLEKLIPQFRNGPSRSQ